ncbi:MAG: hypothetical protein HUJ27_17030 [Rhodobacteraceae bacterium]|nr:hypothetical protein [Paracoccaceae bacterium]
MPDPDPGPLVWITIDPDTPDDREKLTDGLRSLSAEDPTFRADTKPETGQIVLTGMDELHLYGLIHHLLQEFGVKARIGTPTVRCFEGTRHAVTHTSKFKMAIDPTFVPSAVAIPDAEVTLSIWPTEPGEGGNFVSRVAGDTISEEFVAAIEKGVRIALSRGPRCGFPIADVDVALLDASSSAEDPSALGFEKAARKCMRQGLKKAGLIMFEPVMKVEIVTPEEKADSITGDVVNRRGRVLGRDTSVNPTVITALVPLMNLFGYILSLRSMSSGRAEYTAVFDHWQPVPGDDGPDNFRPAIGKRA